MGQVRHGSATTTHAVRAAIQRSQASLSTLSRELGINSKTVAKWRKRATVEDLKTGPKAPHSTTLTEAEEAAVVAFRRHTLLPLGLLGFPCAGGRMSLTPRLRSSFITRSQNLAPSFCSSHRPSTSLAPSARTPSAMWIALLWTMPSSRIFTRSIEEHQRIDLIERPLLPGRYFIEHGVGHRADQVRRYVDAVQLVQMPDVSMTL